MRKHHNEELFDPKLGLIKFETLREWKFTEMDTGFVKSNPSGSGNILMLKKHSDIINWTAILDGCELQTTYYTENKLRCLMIGLGFDVINNNSK